MKVYKSDQLALLSRQFTFAQRHTLSVGMLAMFPLQSGAEPELLAESQLWSEAAAALAGLGVDAPLDEGWPKPAAEFMVLGAAHAGPSGQREARQLSVKVVLGGVSKEVYVFGDREFGLGGLPSMPAPFSRMPIGPAQAFGGPGWAANPVGKGAQELVRPDGTRYRPLPNVEMPGRMMAAVRDTPDTVSLIGLPPDHAARRRHLGKFDDRWLRQSWPNLPDETDLSFFMAASPDQWLRNGLRGDERFEMRNLHPQQANLSGVLPGLRGRCFVHRVQGPATEIAELETHAEKVWFLPEQGLGIILYRASTRIADSDADDISHIMLEWERLSTAPLSFDHYHALFLERIATEAPAVAAEAEVVEMAPPEAPDEPEFSMPAVAAALPAAMAIALDPEMRELERLTDQVREQANALLAEHGLTAQDLPKPPELPDVTIEDLEAETERVRAEVKAFMAEHGLTDADLKPPPAELPDITMAQFEAETDAVKAQTDAFLKQHDLSPADVQAYLDGRPDMADAARINRDSPAALAAEGARLDGLMREAAAVAALATAVVPAVVAMPAVPLVELAEVELPEPVKLTREDVVARYQRGESFEGLDLSGLDLSELDLSRSVFTGSLLAGASFAKSRLASARLDGALLQGADFSEADLTGIDMSGASASEATFAKARMPHGKLVGADLSAGDFSGAELSGADLSEAMLHQAKLADVIAIGCRAVQASFTECALNGADFTRAQLSGAIFSQAQAAGMRLGGSSCDQTDFQDAQMAAADFEGASLRGSRAGAGTSFDGASFVAAQMTRASWEGASAKGARFEQALLDHADLSRLQAQDAVFTGASAQGAKLGKADLTGADLTSVNLLKGSLRKAKLERAVLHHANLYGVDFEETKTTRAALEGADIGQTLFAFRPLA